MESSNHAMQYVGPVADLGEGPGGEIEILVHVFFLIR